jgi:hypothetical protein
MESNLGIYHERQSRQLCALHVLNNLLQEKAFTKSDLDDICTQMAPTSYQWWNPHRSPLGLGNYGAKLNFLSIFISQLFSKFLSIAEFLRLD